MGRFMNISEETHIITSAIAGLLDWEVHQPLWHKYLHGSDHIRYVINKLGELLDHTATREVFEDYQEKLMNHKEKASDKDTN
jgi:hypothetical protein